MHVRIFDHLSSRVASRVLRWDVARSTAPRTSLSNNNNDILSSHLQTPSSSSSSSSSSLSSPSPPNHDLTLYEFEGSPWCRLVREYATVLDLTLQIRPCPRQTLLYGEGSFTSESRFRPDAMKFHRYNIASNSENVNDHLTFPLLVDRTRQNLNIKVNSNNNNNDNNNDDVDVDDDIIVLRESYEIVQHLWEQYGKSVVATKQCRQSCRPDQLLHSNSIPFIIRFLLLCGPSYIRPWPRCGVMRFPTITNQTKIDTTKKTTTNTTTTTLTGTSTEIEIEKTRIILYQSEGCPECRLVREVLCSLEIPYTSVPVTEDGSSSNTVPKPAAAAAATTGTGTGTSESASRVHIPVLEVVNIARPTINDASDNDNSTTIYHTGAKKCVDYLRKTYVDSSNTIIPKWFDKISTKDNIGRNGGASLSVSAYTAFLKGSRSFVPDHVFR